MACEPMLYCFLNKSCLILIQGTNRSMYGYTVYTALHKRLLSYSHADQHYLGMVKQLRYLNLIRLGQNLLTKSCKRTVFSGM